MSAAQSLIDEFVTLATNTRRPFPRLRLGLALLQVVRRNYKHAAADARALPVDGFRPELVAHGQDGEALRHFRLHAACMLLGPPGWLLSAATDMLDHAQAKTGRAESVTECLDNIAGREIGHALDAAIGGEISPADLRARLSQILTPPAA